LLPCIYDEHFLLRGKKCDWITERVKFVFIFSGFKLKNGLSENLDFIFWQSFDQLFFKKTVPEIGEMPTEKGTDADRVFTKDTCGFLKSNLK